MSPSELIGKGPKVYTEEEVTRRLERLQNICDVFAERLSALDNKTLVTVCLTRGMRIEAAPK